MRFLDHLLGGDSSKPQDIALEKIDTEMIQFYEAYLKNVVKVCRNTSSFYLRILRSVYNKTVEQGLVTSQQHPNLFKNVYTGIDKTRKRAIGAETVKTIQQLDLSSTPMHEMAQYTFWYVFIFKASLSLTWRICARVTSMEGCCDTTEARQADRYM